MANSASSKKRIRQSERNRKRNQMRRSVVKTETRKFLDVLQRGDAAGAQDAFARVQKKLDQVVAKGTLHRNTVARRKSRLARRLNAVLAKASSAPAVAVGT